MKRSCSVALCFGDVLQHAFDAAARQRGADHEALAAVAAGDLHLGVAAQVHLLVQLRPRLSAKNCFQRRAAGLELVAPSILRRPGWRSGSCRTCRA
jgi:hypothetical protein